MIDLEGIRSLTDFKRNTAEFLRKLKETGRPQVLTIGGRAAIVVQDAASYQRLLELIDRAEAIDGIRRGLEDAARGRTKPAAQVLAGLRRPRKAVRRR